MSSIWAMGPLFFHRKNKLWVWGGRSRLALSENIKKYFFGAVYDRFMPSKPANLRAPIKIRFSIFFEKSKILLILWYGVAASSFFPRCSAFLIWFDHIFFEFYFLMSFLYFKELVVAKNYNICFRAEWRRH